MKSQRTSPDLNADLGCVPTGIASALQYETGREFEPNQIKDAVYGQDFVGGTAASAYVDYATQHGVHLFAIDGQGMNLISAALARA